MTVTGGLSQSTLTPEEKITQIEKLYAERLSQPSHPSVAHITPTPESYIIAAEYQRDDKSLVSWLHNASMAEGIATALYEVTGRKGSRERAVLRKATHLRVEAELALLTELRELQEGYGG